MVELIVTMDKKGGIGYQNCHPWFCEKEREIFKRKINGKTLIVGRKTAETLPKLKARKIICVTRNLVLNTSNWKNEVILTDKIINNDDLLDGNTIIAGCSQIYEEVLKNVPVYRVHLSIMNKEYECDVFFRMEWLKNFDIVDRKDYPEFIHYVLARIEKDKEPRLEEDDNEMSEDSSRYTIDKKAPANQIIEMLSQITLQNEKIQEKLEKANIENNKLKKMLKVMAKITLTESFYNDCDMSDNDK